jgi:hypothetical protein
MSDEINEGAFPDLEATKVFHLHARSPGEMRDVYRACAPEGLIAAALREEGACGVVVHAIRDELWLPIVNADELGAIRKIAQAAAMCTTAISPVLAGADAFATHILPSLRHYEVSTALLATFEDLGFVPVVLASRHTEHSHLLGSYAQRVAFESLLGLAVWWTPAPEHASRVTVFHVRPAIPAPPPAASRAEIAALEITDRGTVHLPAKECRRRLERDAPSLVSPDKPLAQEMLWV